MTQKAVFLIIITAVILLIIVPFSIAEKETKEAGLNWDNLISLDIKDGSLKTVLKLISQQSGLNFVADRNVEDRRITVYFTKVTVKDALKNIVNANNLTYEKETGSDIFIVKEIEEPKVVPITEIFKLKYAQLTKPPLIKDTKADSGEIISVIKGALSSIGSVVADKRSNMLIVTDIPQQMEIIRKIVETLDVRALQVMIEAEIVETDKTVADQLGMDWSGAFGVYAGPVMDTKWPLKGSLIDKDAITTNGTMSLRTMGFSLNALLSNTNTKILARPRVLTLNNETALIELTANTAIASMTTTTNTGSTEISTTSTGAERIETGITLSVTPQINEDNYITLHIEPTVIVPVLSTFFTGTDGQKFVDTQKRSARTTVMVKDGETIVIGGLISNEATHTLEKIPLLGDIPLLGAAFRYKTKNDTDRELIILITPRIVKNVDNEDLTKKDKEFLMKSINANYPSRYK